MSLIERGHPQINIQTILNHPSGRMDQTSTFITPLAKTCFDEIQRNKLGFTHRIAQLALSGFKLMVTPTAIAAAGKFVGDHIYIVATVDKFYEAVGKIVSHLLLFGVAVYALKMSGLLEIGVQKIVAIAETALQIPERVANEAHSIQLHQPQIKNSLMSVYNEMAESLEGVNPITQEHLNQAIHLETKLPTIRRAIRKVGVEAHEVLKRIEIAIHKIINTRVEHGDHATPHNVQLLQHLSTNHFVARMYSHKTLTHLQESENWKIPKSLIGTISPLLTTIDLSKLVPTSLSSYVHFDPSQFKIPISFDHFRMGLYTLGIASSVLALYEFKKHHDHAAAERAQARDDVHTVLRNISLHLTQHQEGIDLIRPKVDAIKKRLRKDGFDADLLTLPA